MPSMTSQARPELKRSRWPSFVAASFLTLVAFAQCGCDRAVPDSSGEKAFASRAESRLQGDVTVHAAVLTDDESRRYFGASLADEGIQAIWLSVENGGDSRLRFLPIITDPSYFSPPEVEQLLHSWWRRRIQCGDRGEFGARRHAGSYSARANGRWVRLHASRRWFEVSSGRF